MELKPITKKNYEIKLKQLNLVSPLNDFDELKKCVEKQSDNIGTNKNTYCAILWAVKTGQIESTINEQISNEIGRIRIQEERKREQNKITDKQKDVFLEWNEIVKLRDKLSNEIDADNYAFYVFLCIFTEQPIRRLEDTTLYVYNRKPPMDDKNYLIINDKHAYVVYNVYKTSWKYGKTRYKLSNNLHTIISTYISELNVRQGSPLFGYRLSNSFGKYLSTCFEKYTGKSVTINVIRHSFITDLNLNKKLSVAKKKQIALKMAHSAQESEKYSFHMSFTPS